MLCILLEFVLSQIASRNPRMERSVVCCLRMSYLAFFLWPYLSTHILSDSCGSCGLPSIYQIPWYNVSAHSVPNSSLCGNAYGMHYDAAHGVCILATHLNYVLILIPYTGIADQKRQSGLVMDGDAILGLITSLHEKLLTTTSVLCPLLRSYHDEGLTAKVQSDLI